MEDHETLLVRSSARDTSSIAESLSSLSPHALPLLCRSLRVERKHEGAEVLISLLHPEARAEGQPQLLTAAARAFLAQHVSPAVLEVFPEWQGVLLEFPALEGVVWVVHHRQDGQQLARETGKPAILLEALLAQQGRTLEETRGGVDSPPDPPYRADRTEKAQSYREGSNTIDVKGRGTPLSKPQAPRTATREPRGVPAKEERANESNSDSLRASRRPAVFQSGGGDPEWDLSDYRHAPD